ncbi:MAG: 2-oxoglutarate dehydrogenase, partial [Magnetococcales bacterium]|nr:2-oxoglutarate dehydrogenase [Magnetococcales bacterium]
METVRSMDVPANRPFVTDARGHPRIGTDAESLYGFGHLIRRTEQLLLDAFARGEVAGTIHTGLGQEICQMAVVRALDPGRDFLLSNHRNHGHFLTWCGDFAALIAEVTARSGGACGGWGGSQHLAGRRFWSTGIQGGLTGVAAGLALAARLAGQGAMGAVLLGDGTLGQGQLYESLNLAALWRAPLLFVVENNRIAQTTPTAWGVAGDILARGAAFGLVTLRLGDREEDFIPRVATFVQGIRAGTTPGFLVIDTARMGPHSKGDDVRDPAELAEISRNNPLDALGRRLPPATRQRLEETNEAFLTDLFRQVAHRPPARFAAPPDVLFRRWPP